MRRPPRLAETVADDLRQRILAGEFSNGAPFPKQDELVDRFGVSLPSAREALRILELEGLITVQRGKVGGSVVHVPQTAKVAYMLGLVLEGRATELDDVVFAMTSIEPLCAMACANRKDRKKSVVPRLEAVQAESEAAAGDPAAFAASARRFHEELVATCGNDTFIVVVGALEMLWSAHVRDLAAGELGEFARIDTRRRSLAEHRALIDAIAAGDADEAGRIAREHAAAPLRHGRLGKGEHVRATALRDH